MTESRTFVLCGHRGNMADTPENTLASFASAERVGVDEIELDVRVTLDGVLVVIHDWTVDRTAAVASPYLHTPIEELTYDQLQTIDLGDGARIPTFEETLDATTVLLQVEIKAPGAARPLAKFLKARADCDQKRCLVTSFYPLSLRDYADVWADTPRGIALHVPEVDTTWRDDMRRLGVSTLLIPIHKLTRSLVDELHEGGYLVSASLLEGPGEVRRLLEIDADTSASNAPEYARRMLLADDEFMARFPTFGDSQAVGV